MHHVCFTLISIIRSSAEFTCYPLKNLERPFASNAEITKSVCLQKAIATILFSEGNCLPSFMMLTDNQSMISQPSATDSTDHATLSFFPIGSGRVL